MTLQKETRDAIGRTVRSLRELFEGEFGKQASGRFGIRSSPRGNESDGSELDAWLDPDESLSLTPAEFAQRNELIHALRYLTSEGNAPDEAVARLIREAAFTAVNRLLAIRVAEAIGVLPAVLSSGRHSAGYRDTVGDLFPGLALDEDDYWIYVQIAGDELAPAVPRLFDRRHPTSAFIPSRACVDRALELLTADELAGAWDEPEALGWGYQFFNGDDVKQMRDVSSTPRNSRELAVRNQFFTPRYVVDWLVQNTLGRRLLQAGYELDLPLLVGEVGDHEPIELDDVCVLDPAVGSGHFLLGSYDLLEGAWASTGVPPEEAASKILPCLFGVDIDPRAAQVAQAVLFLRARRSAPNANLIPPTIATAVALPHTEELREQAFGNLSPAARNLADEVAAALDQAPLLGSLLKVEQRLQTELASHRSAPRLAADGAEAQVLEELHHSLDELVSNWASPEQRMFTAEAADALRFLDICQRRYDAVLMNPPFGEPVAASKDYLKAAYQPGWSDLFAAFVSRGVELTKPDGHVGAITTRSGFFLTTFADWRSDLVLPRLVGLLDLGIGVMHDAMVRAATYVLGPQVPGRQATFARLLEAKDKEAAVYNLTTDQLVTRPPDAFRAIPEAPVAYWLPEQLLSVFVSHDQLEGETASIRVGLQTSDNFRFVRLWWEVSPQRVGLGRTWRSFATGGAFAPYYADLHTVVDWQDDGRRIRQFHTEELGYSETRLVRSADHYFRPGLTWNRRSEGFFVSLVPAGAVFSNNGQMIFVRDDDEETLFELMAYLNSAAAGALIEPMVGAEQYEVGMVQRLPLVRLSPEAGRLARELWRCLRERGKANELDHLFVAPVVAEGESEQLVKLSAQVDALVSTTLGDGGASPQSGTTPTQWLERHVVETPAKDAAELLSYAVGAAFGRWDLRFALGISPPPVPGPTEPLPTSARGMLTDSDGAHPVESPDSYPIPLPADGLLHDDPGHTFDIVRSIDRVVSLLGENSSLPMHLVSTIKDLRKHLRAKFFAAHLRQYSASRRYAPIYWHLAVPSKRWGLWLYAPSLSRESLFAIVRATRDKLSSLNEQVGLARERTETDRDARERAESLEDLAAEVEKFAAVADEVAQSGWEPDINDGFVLNAAPLEELFVDRTWRSQIAKHRKSMQKGDYPWATVQREYFEKRT